MTMSAPPRNPRADAAQRVGVARRVVRLDMTWPESAPGDPRSLLVVSAHARDSLLDDFGLRILAEASIAVEIEPGAKVAAISCEPGLAGVESLVGRRASSGWRQAVRELLPDTSSPLGQLLDDLPVAVLVSGYAGLRTGQLQAMTGEAKQGTASRMADVCAGWSTGSTALIALTGRGHAIVPELVGAPEWDQWDGEAGRLRTGDVRRERRLDVWPGVDAGALQIEATFRDTWGDRREGEAILHEYVVDACVDAVGRIVSLSADPRVLPYPECPSATRAIVDLIGERIDDVSSTVPEVLTGISSCTHLNDLLRSMGGTPALATALQA